MSRWSTMQNMTKQKLQRKQLTLPPSIRGLYAIQTIVENPSAIVTHYRSEAKEGVRLIEHTARNLRCAGFLLWRDSRTYDFYDKTGTLEHVNCSPDTVTTETNSRCHIDEQLVDNTARKLLGPNYSRLVIASHHKFSSSAALSNMSRMLIDLSGRNEGDVTRHALVDLCDQPCRVYGLYADWGALHRNTADYYLDTYAKWKGNAPLAYDHFLHIFARRLAGLHPERVDDITRSACEWVDKPTMVRASHATDTAMAPTIEELLQGSKSLREGINKCQSSEMEDLVVMSKVAAMDWLRGMEQFYTAQAL